MLVRQVDWNGLAKSVAGAYEYANFEFVIQRARWAEDRFDGGRRLGLSARSANLLTADDDP